MLGAKLYVFLEVPLFLGGILENNAIFLADTPEKELLVLQKVQIVILAVSTLGSINAVLEPDLVRAWYVFGIY